MSLLQEIGTDPRRAFVLCSIERIDVRKREFLWRTRALVQDGVQTAVATAREVVSNHVESRRVLEHSLRLADMYSELARAYVSAVDPASHEFNVPCCCPPCYGTPTPLGRRVAPSVCGSFSSLAGSWSRPGSSRLRRLRCSAL